MMNLTAPSNALEIAAKRAKDICDRFIDSQIQQGIWQEAMDARKVVKTLRAIAGQNHWSIAVKHAQKYNEQVYLAHANSNLLRCVKVCQPQIKKHSSVEKFLDYAETLIPVQES